MYNQGTQRHVDVAGLSSAEVVWRIWLSVLNVSFVYSLCISLQAHIQCFNQWVTLLVIHPSKHMTLIQPRLNVDATSWRCIDVELTLHKRHVPAGTVTHLVSHHPATVSNSSHVYLSNHHIYIQSNLVISNLLISNYRLSRSENLVPVLTWNYDNR